MDDLFRWDVLGWVLAFFVPLGVGAIALREYKFAKICFTLSAVVLAGKMFMWARITEAPFWQRAGLSILLFGTIGVALVESTRWIERKKADSESKPLVQNLSAPLPSPGSQTTSQEAEKGQNAGDEIKRRGVLLEKLRQEYILSHDNISPALMAGTEQPPSAWINKRLKQLGETWTVSKTDTVQPPSFRPVVEFEVSKQKLFVIHNRGVVPVEEIEITPTEYIFDESAFQAHQLKIETYSKVGGPTVKIPTVRARSESKPVDLTKSPLLEFTNFPSNDSQDTLFLRKYYCLRILFRDGNSKKQYVYYRVTGSVKNAPSFFENLDQQAISGTGRPFWLSPLPEIIKDHQRNLYGKDVEEYVP